MRHPLERDLDHVLDHTPGIWEALAGQRIFITGGTGFVGIWLLDSLILANERLGVDVKATVLTRDPDAFRRKAPETAGHSSISCLSGDVGSFPFPEYEFRFVIHAATERQFTPTAEAPAGMFEADVKGTRRVLEFARTHGTRRFLFTSSGAIYGKQPPDLTHIPEDYPGAPSTIEPGTSYEHAKRAGEWLSVMHARQYEFDALIARLFAFIGPRLPLDINFAAGNFVRDVLAGGPVRIKGDGSPWRSYLYAADLAIWIWTILVRGKSGRPYNVGSPVAVTIAELARIIVDATVPGTSIETANALVPGALASRYVPLATRVETELGLRPLVSLEEGARRTYKWAETRRLS